MMDLIQLLLPQQSAKPIEISEDIPPSTEIGTKEDEATFIAIMAHFLRTQNVSETNPLKADSIKQTDSGCEEVDSQHSQSSATEEPALSSKAIELGENSADEHPIPLQDRISLAWFESESFEPPLLNINTKVFEASKESMRPEGAEQDNSEVTEVTAIALSPQLAS